MNEPLLRLKVYDKFSKPYFLNQTYYITNFMVSALRAFSSIRLNAFYYHTFGATHLELSWNSRISGNSMVERMVLVAGKAA